MPTESVLEAKSKVASNHDAADEVGRGRAKSGYRSSRRGRTQIKLFTSVVGSGILARTQMAEARKRNGRAASGWRIHPKPVELNELSTDERWLLRVDRKVRAFGRDVHPGVWRDLLARRLERDGAWADDAPLTRESVLALTLRVQEWLVASLQGDACHPWHRHARFEPFRIWSSSGVSHRLCDPGTISRRSSSSSATRTCTDVVVRMRLHSSSGSGWPNWLSRCQSSSQSRFVCFLSVAPSKRPPGCQVVWSPSGYRRNSGRPPTPLGALRRPGR